MRNQFNIPTLFGRFDELTSKYVFPTFTLLQPWASLVIQGRKLLETRSWETPYRGILFIHASKTVKREDRAKFLGHLKFPIDLHEALAHPNRPQRADNRNLPASQVLGVVILRGCIATETKLRELEREHNLTEIVMGDYSEGRFAWELTDRIEFCHPVPYDGNLGIWDALRGRRSPVDILKLSMELEPFVGSGAPVEYKDLRRELRECYEILRLKPDLFPQYKNLVK